MRKATTLAALALLCTTVGRSRKPRGRGGRLRQCDHDQCDPPGRRRGLRRRRAGDRSGRHTDRSQRPTSYRAQEPGQRGCPQRRLRPGSGSRAASRSVRSTSLRSASSSRGGPQQRDPTCSPEASTCRSSLITPTEPCWRRTTWGSPSGCLPAIRPRPPRPIRLVDTSHATVRDNYAQLSGYGILLVRSDHNVLRGNGAAPVLLRWQRVQRHRAAGRGPEHGDGQHGRSEPFRVRAGTATASSWTPPVRGRSSRRTSRR